MSAKSNRAKTYEDQALLLAAQKGDKIAFGQLVVQYHRLIVSVAYRICGDAEMANDIAQDTFLRAWRRLPEFRPESNASFRAWLCRIAHNRTIDLLRKRRPQSELDPWLPAPNPLPDTLAIRNETAREIQTAILKLPEGARAALILREYEDLSYAEIAEALDIPIGTVMSRLHNARKRLLKELAPLMRDTLP